jgi:hypothetical protein
LLSINHFNVGALKDTRRFKSDRIAIIGLDAPNVIPTQFIFHRPNDSEIRFLAENRHLKPLIGGVSLTAE